MSELREECYKCLNNQSCISSANYGSIYCQAHRKFKMPKHNGENIYVSKEQYCEYMKQKELIEKQQKEIKESKEVINHKIFDIIKKSENIIFKNNYIPKSKIEEKIKELETQNETSDDENYMYREIDIINRKIDILKELLESEE